MELTAQSPGTVISDVDNETQVYNIRVLFSGVEQMELGSKRENNTAFDMQDCILVHRTCEGNGPASREGVQVRFEGPTVHEGL